MESKDFGILLAGVGGQGIIFAGQIIMESALKQGFSVLGFEEHGMARRGGAVATHIRFGKNVYTPLVPIGSGKVLVSFEPAEALRHLHFLDIDSKIILNSKPTIPVSVSSGLGSYPTLNEIMDVLMSRTKEVFAFDAQALAMEAGSSLALNIVMLGAASASGTTPLEKKTFLNIISGRSPSYSRDINLKAFELGYKKLIEEV